MGKWKALLLSQAVLIFIIILVWPAFSQAQTSLTSRLAGETRYATAVKVSQAGWNNSAYALLASGQDYADALCAGPLACRYSAPILLTGPRQIPAEVLTELKRLKPKHVFVIGGSQAIADTAESQLKQLGIPEVERIGGRDRYETSVLIAQRLFSPQEAALVSGQSPWDALAFSVIAAQRRVPLLLTPGDNLPLVVRNYLDKAVPSDTYLLGGKKVLSVNIENMLPGSTRIGGRDRYETNILILKKFTGELKFTRIYLVSGGGDHTGFADALCAAVLAGKTASPLILASGSGLSVLPVNSCLSDQFALTGEIIAVGGEAAVPAVVLNKINDYIEKRKESGGHDSGGYDFDGGGFTPVIDTKPPSAILISAQNAIPGKGSLILQVVDGPLRSNSWADILGEIRANTASGKGWITGICPNDLGLLPAADGVSAVLSNSSINPAGIAADFVIPAAKVVDTAGNAAQGKLTIDAHLPAVVCEVSALTGNGMYKAGDTIEITLAFNSKVNVIGTPLLELQTGALVREAAYQGGDGAAVLTFSYTVQPGDLSPKLDYTSNTALNLNGGSITIAHTPVDALLSLPYPGEPGSLSRSREILIDARPPAALKISAQNSIAGRGSVTLRVEDGPLRDESWADILKEIQANSGPGGSWITGISAADLTLIPSGDGVTAVLCNSNTNAANIIADFTIPAAKLIDRAGNTAGGDITVDSYLPMMVTEVSSLTGEGYYKEGTDILLTVCFDRPVDVEGTPALELETGTADRLAYYSGGSGTAQLTFTYTVQAGDNSPDLDYRGKDALKLNGGTIKDSVSGDNANLTLPGEPGKLFPAGKIVIDTEAPTAISISSQDIIPAQSSVALTVTGGPLSYASWTAILNCIKSKVPLGEWLYGIQKNDLSFTEAADGASVILNNENPTNPAIIKTDFNIPAVLVVDRAGNPAPANIIIDAKS